MKIITRYMMSSLVPNYFVGLSFFTIMLIVNEVFRLVKYVVERNIPIEKVSKLFVFTFPYILALTIPMAVLMASVLTFGRLSTDSEIIALRGSGISLMRIIKPNLLFGVILFFLALLFFDTILPWGNTQYIKMKRQIFIRDPMADFEARQVIRLGNRSLRYESEDSVTKRMYNIYITAQDGTVTFAKYGDFIEKTVVGNKLLIRFRLFEVSTHEIDQKRPKELLKTYSPEVIQTFVENYQEARNFVKTAKTMSIGELYNKIKRENVGRVKQLENLKKKLHEAKTGLKKAKTDYRIYKEKHPKEFRVRHYNKYKRLIGPLRNPQQFLSAGRFIGPLPRPFHKRTPYKFIGPLTKPHGYKSSKNKNKFIGPLNSPPGYRKRTARRTKRSRRAVRRNNRRRRIAKRKNYKRRRAAAKRRVVSRSKRILSKKKIGKQTRRNKYLKSKRKNNRKIVRDRRYAKRNKKRTTHRRRNYKIRNKRDRRKTHKRRTKKLKRIKNKIYYQNLVRNKELRLKTIKKQYQNMQNFSYRSPTDVYELHKKLALPFACFIFTLIGAPLGMFSRRTGKSMGFGYGIIVMIIYYFLLTLGQGWVISGKSHPIFSAWMPNLFLGVVGIFLIIKKVTE